MHRFVPPKNNNKTMILALHGTGGNEDDLLPLAKMIDDQAAILSPRGKVLENGMPRFFRRLDEGVFDIEDLKFRTNELVDFLANNSKKYGFDPKSVVALGYSNGANIAASMMLLRPESLKGAVLFRAMIPLQPEKMPNLSGKKIFISAGRFDTLIPQPKTRELAELFEKLGASVSMNWEGSNHSLTSNEIEKARIWLKAEVG
ncbi:MAG: alpha/beta hydrolase [Thaumarchaeota archaeon]|nr:alpha/beta hydrolase [Nitrososphaerota archaeon]